MTEAQPVKRRPGRPRKNPLPPAETVEVTPDSVAVETVAVAETPADEPAAPADERIGTEVHPLASHIGYDDGRQYRCEGGLIVERLD